MEPSTYSLTSGYRRRLLMIIGAVLAIPIYSFVIMSVFRVLVFDQPQAAEDVVFGCLIASGGTLCYLLAREHHLFAAAALIIVMLAGAGVADLMMDQTPVTELGPSLTFLMAIVLASVVFPSPWSLVVSFGLWAVFSTSVVLWALGDIGKDLHYHDADVAVMGIFLFTLTVLFLVISVRVSIRDLLRQVAETRGAEEDLRAEKGFAVTMLNTVQAIVLILDEDGNIVRYNQYLEDLTGRPLEKFRGLNWFETFLPERDQAEIQELFKQAMRKNHSTAGAVNAIMTIEGQEIMIEWHDAQITYEDDQSCLLAIGVDVTERSRLEEQRDRLSEMQTQFMQNASHEMRTPLGLILGYSEMMQAGEFGDLGDELSGALDIISRRARELKVLVGDIAIILELEDRALAGLHVDREPVAIGAMARMLLNDYALIAKVDGIVLEDNIGDVAVMGSYKMLQRALDNVIRNALKFTPRDGVIRVVVGLEEGKALIEVADTGVGIQPEALPFVFERFYQANGSPTRRFAGSGLGLALVKEVVEAHWGTVTIESEIGVGTTIRLLVPLGISPA